jgi:type IV pilus assembly protein PilF
MPARNPRSFPALAILVAVTSLAACSSTKAPPAPDPVMPAPQPQLVKPQEVSPEVRAQVRVDLATGYFERGQLDVALQELNEAVKLDPRNPRVYNLYGLVYGMLGENTNAEQNFRRALELSPTDSEIRQNWGWFLCTHGRARESLAEFDAAVRNPLYRTPDVSLTNAGKCAAAIGESRRAEEYFRRALAVSPTNATAAYNLSLLAYKESRLPDARAFMKPVMQQPNPPAEALYLGMCIERKLGDGQAEMSYVSQLRNRYPDSAEARAIATGGCD